MFVSSYRRTRLLLSLICGLLVMTGLFLAPGLHPFAHAQSTGPGPAGDTDPDPSQYSIPAPAPPEPLTPANGNQVDTQFQTPTIEVNYARDWVSIETEPNAAFTVTVVGKATYTGQANSSGNFRTTAGGWVPAQPNIQPGDQVTVQTAGYTRSVNPVGTIKGAVNTQQDTIAGTIQAPGFAGTLRVLCEVRENNAPPAIETTAAANGGSYLCDFGAVGWDLRGGQDVSVTYFEPDGDSVTNIFRSPYARAYISGDWVDGWFGPNVRVQYAVTDQQNNVKGGGSGTAGSDGQLSGVGCNCDMVPGDQVRVTSSAGFDATLSLITIDGQIDAGADRVSGVMSGGQFPGKGNVSVSSDGRSLDESMDVNIAANGSYAAQFGGRFDILPGDWVRVWYYTPDGNEISVDIRSLHIEVAYDEDYVRARTEPNASIRIEVVGKATFAGQADSSGRLRTSYYGWNPARPDIRPGDRVIAGVIGWTKSVDPVGRITAIANTAGNTIAGKIYHSAATTNLRVGCEVWEDNGPPDVDAVPPFVSPNGGSFVCDFRQVGWDLRPGQRVAVRVYEPDSDQFIHSFTAQSPAFLPLMLRQ